MALTAEGRALTEAHRLRQLATSARAAARASQLWSGLDADNIDASMPAWLSRNLVSLREFHRESVDRAAAYVPAYRRAELGRNFGSIERPDFDTAETAQALVLAGPVRVKLLTKRGMTSTKAQSEALRKFQGIVRRQTMAGGRQLIDQTTESDQRAIGWRRVTDSKPCAFCAMLASRGPVYRSASTAGTDGGGLLDNKSGLRFHSHCGCTAEIVYGEWKPSEREQGFLAQYQEAAQAANADGFSRTEASVLPRMRAAGNFRDSPTIRNNPTS
jgi:hypothetical protein